MNCSGVAYISKYVYPEDLECWIIDKAKAHILNDCIGSISSLPSNVLHRHVMEHQPGPSIRDHINDCDRCNQKYRIGKTTTKGKASAGQTKRTDHTARLNRYRYSIPRIDHAWIPTRG